jgi:FdhD protein
MRKIIQESSLSHNRSKKSKINKHTIDDSYQVEDSIAIESPLEIRLGHNNVHFKTLSITMCSPADVEDLVYGYLFTEGIISKASDVKALRVYDNDFGKIAETVLDKSIAFEQFLQKSQGIVHASCGVCGKTQIDDLLVFKYTTLQAIKNEVKAEIICSLPDKINHKQQAFNQTGGLHASALFACDGDLLLIREDVGRHNALDKLIGVALQQDLLPMKDKLVLLSGRISFELVHKSLMAGVTTLCAIGAPSSLSVEIAKINQLRLLGFVKKTGFNSY